MGLTEANSVATPGLKRSFTDETMDLVLDEEESTELVAPLPFDENARTVRLSPVVEFHEVRPYSFTYGAHPHSFVFGPTGNKITIHPGCDVFTGQTHAEMTLRRDSIVRLTASRAHVFRRVLRCGSAWEEPTSLRVAKVSKKFTKKRIGAKAAKSAERFVSPGNELNAEESTMYRALAARANYLSLDRPDVSYATK